MGGNMGLDGLLDEQNAAENNDLSDLNTRLLNAGVDAAEAKSIADSHVHKGAVQAMREKQIAESSQLQGQINQLSANMAASAGQRAGETQLGPIDKFLQDNANPEDENPEQSARILRSMMNAVADETQRKLQGGMASEKQSQDNLDALKNRLPQYRSKVLVPHVGKEMADEYWDELQRATIETYRDTGQLVAPITLLQQYKQAEYETAVAKQVLLRRKQQADKAGDVTLLGMEKQGRQNAPQGTGAPARKPKGEGRRKTSQEALQSLLRKMPGLNNVG